MPVLSAHDLGRAYGPQTVLDRVSVAVGVGERVGLVGRNGSGKSTLARILAGIEEPDTGHVVRARDSRVGYVPQEPEFEGDPTAREAIFEGLDEWNDAKRRYDMASEAIEAGRASLDAWLAEQAEAASAIERLGGWDPMHRIEAVMGHLGIEAPTQPVRRMSGGERRRVALARVLVAQPALAIFDEPTNHLDTSTIDWLETHLRDEFPGAVLVVTHDRYLLDRVVHRTLELSRGALYSYEGGWEAYLAAKAERMAHEARAEANRQRYLARELEWLKRQPKARTSKDKARIQRIEAARNAPEAEREGRVELDMHSTRTGNTILELHDLALEVGDTRLVDGLELALRPRDRIGVLGRNGSGKTTLLRAIRGELDPAAGRIVRGKNTRIAYLAQSREALDDRASIHENVAGARAEVEVGGRTVDIRTYLGRFLFDRGRIRQPVGSLSGGERARVALAKLLLEPANLLLLDEPTNDLDVDTIGALEQMLLEFEGAMLVVTHDRYFLDRIASSILSFEGHRRVVPYVGNYSTYRTLREQEAPDTPRANAGREQSASASARPKRREASPRPKKALTANEERELEDLMTRIQQAEQRVAELESQAADPSMHAERGDEVPELLERLEAARGEVDRLMTRWEELETKRQQAGTS